MSRPIVYIATWSPPSCAVRMTAKAIGLELDVQKLCLLKGEHRARDYAKINPQKTVPTLIDDGFTLWDSHSIMTYLVGKYAKNDALYSKDLKKRAIIDQRLYFDNGSLFPILIGTIIAALGGTIRSIPTETIQKLDDAYNLMNILLEDKSWLAGDAYTLADISCSATLNSLAILHPIDNYTNVVKWLKNCEDLPGFKDITAVGAEEGRALFKAKLFN